MVGSAALAAQLKQARQPLKLMVSLEMLAYTSPSQDYPHPAMRAMYGDRGDFIALVANTGAGLLLPVLARAMGRHVPTNVLPVPFGGRAIPDVRLSDHSPFWDQGYDALMVTDTSFMRNPHDHQMSDTVETLDLPFFCGVVEGLAGA
ncbi:MAG: M28 family peptidase, partial [Cyanobium sp.]